jgi:hypothetical protein
VRLAADHDEQSVGGHLLNRLACSIGERDRFERALAPTMNTSWSDMARLSLADRP